MIKSFRYTGATPKVVNFKNSGNESTVTLSGRGIFNLPADDVTIARLIKNGELVEAAAYTGDKQGFAALAEQREAEGKKQPTETTGTTEATNSQTDAQEFTTENTGATGDTTQTDAQTNNETFEATKEAGSKKKAGK